MNVEVGWGVHGVVLIVGENAFGLTPDQARWLSKNLTIAAECVAPASGATFIDPGSDRVN